MDEAPEKCKKKTLKFSFVNVIFTTPTCFVTDSPMTMYENILIKLKFEITFDTVPQIRPLN